MTNRPLPHMIAVLAVGTAALGLTSRQFSVTPDGAPYTYTDVGGGTVTVTAPATAGGNERQFFWSSQSATEAATSACATFNGGLDIDQPGIAMRIADNGNRAVTVIENVFGGHAFNRFNFHVWNTAHSPAFTQFGSVTISALPATPATYPLSMCARITGDLVQFIVWTSGSRPPWGDREWGGQAVLPTSAPRSGQTGFYVGHLTAGSSLTYSGLTVDGQMSDPTS